MHRSWFAFLVASLMTSVSAIACDDGITAFQATVYAKVRRDCAKCHDGSNPKAPPFATADMQSSYNQLLSYMNFSKIEESLLLFRAGNGHCGMDNCRETSGKEMLDLATQWWDRGEKVCERNGHYFTQEMPLPDTLPTKDQGFMTISFDLGTIKPELSGMSFQIEAQSYIEKAANTRGMYRFRSPRIVGGKNSVYVKDIKVLVNGRFDVIYNVYTTIDRVVPFFAVKDAVGRAVPVLSSETLLTLKDELPNPKLSISFVEIEPRDEPGECINMDGFKSGVIPLLATGNCVSCHDGNGKTMGEKVLNCNAEAGKLCQIVSALVDPRYYRVSPFITVPSQGVFNHPALTDAQRYDYVKVVKNWLGK